MTRTYARSTGVQGRACRWTWKPGLIPWGLRRTGERPAFRNRFSRPCRRPARRWAMQFANATLGRRGVLWSNADGVEEVVAVKGYHSGEVLAEMQAMEVPTYIA